ncbi:MAG: response regulator [Lachnospiraceae bacterium]|nr:response regulator [Lachnospiraceae bacterium]
MNKILIVDDEILVQVGIQSLLNQTTLNVQVCGTARNGQIALELIEEQSPDIVITDIKMPVMDGLELARICQERYGSAGPGFIILTSYEDFQMAKRALTYQVSDYLIKLELTPEILQESITRALSQLHRTEKAETGSENTSYLFYDKFFINLLHNLFESDEQFTLQSRDLKLDFHYAGYVCCYGEIVGTQADTLPRENQLSLFAASLKMIRELAPKYMPCYALSLDIQHFALIFCYETLPPSCASGECCSYFEEISDILTHVSDALKNYYSVSLQCGVGSLVNMPLNVSNSYQYSRQAYQASSPAHPIAFIEQLGNADSHNSFNIGLFRSDLCKAFEEYDPEILLRTIVAICELFSAHPQHYVQALDAACNILYLSISTLPDGEEVISEIYKDFPGGYRSVYKQTTAEQVMSWLNGFGEKLSAYFEEKRRDYKNHIVINVKKYINNHIREHLSLNEVAAVFGISPNYLSQLFGKYNDTGFNEYINICKIGESKKLLAEGNYKVYEIADMLGFESAFYFSKVFKKIEGISPTEYQNTQYV